MKNKKNIKKADSEVNDSKVEEVQDHLDIFKTIDKEGIVNFYYFVDSRVVFALKDSSYRNFSVEITRGGYWKIWGSYESSHFEISGFGFSNLIERLFGKSI